MHNGDILILHGINLLWGFEALIRVPYFGFSFILQIDITEVVNIYTDRKHLLMTRIPVLSS